jgi:hypothetical protein
VFGVNKLKWSTPRIKVNLCLINRDRMNWWRDSNGPDCKRFNTISVHTIANHYYLVLTHIWQSSVIQAWFPPIHSWEWTKCFC